MQGSRFATLPQPDSILKYFIISECLFVFFLSFCLEFFFLQLELVYIYFYVLIQSSKSAVPSGVLHGCGDLIFSSHMIFTLVFVRTYHKYGTRRYI